MNKFYLEALGFIAGIIIVRAYQLVSTGKINGEGLNYNIRMAIGCALYTVYSLMVKAPAMMFIQVFFIIAAAKALYKCFKNKNTKHPLRSSIMKNPFRIIGASILDMLEIVVQLIANIFGFIATIIKTIIMICKIILVACLVVVLVTLAFALALFIVTWLLAALSISLGGLLTFLGTIIMAHFIAAAIIIALIIIIVALVVSNY